MTLAAARTRNQRAVLVSDQAAAARADGKALEKHIKELSTE